MTPNKTSEPDKQNYPDYVEKEFVFKIPKGQTPERVDTYLTNAIYNATRNKVKKAIDDGKVWINGKQAKPGRKIQPLDEIICRIMKAPPIELLPENIPLNILYEDEYLLVVNKPAGMCTHPGFGHRYGTLVNALLYHFGMRDAIEIETGDEDDEETDEDDNDIDNINLGKVFASDVIRPGIVHRLDMDTSGVLVIAKNVEIHAKLSKQFADRTTERQYNTIVWGKFDEDEGTVEGDIGRSPRNRKLFAVVKKDGKHAKTDYKVIERFEFATLVALKLHTGRTHQIRVHMAHINHPVMGDTFYGGDKPLYSGHDPHLKNLAKKSLEKVQRQLLHAKTLGFKHPATKEFLSFDSPLPEDMEGIIQLLRQVSEI